MPSKEEVKIATLSDTPWISGLKDVAGSGPPVVDRVDIDILWKKYPKTFNVFVLALDALAKGSTSAPMGYFQIAGRMLSFQRVAVC